MKILLALINLVALIGAVAWLVIAPDWDPMITAIALLGVLLAQVFASEEVRSKVGLTQKSRGNSHNYQATGSQTITDNKKLLQAGDGSQQLQADQLIVNIGIDEKRAREVFHEMNLQLRQDYTKEALGIANARVSEFEKSLMPKMEKVDGALEAFADPSFQLLLVEAQKTAASTDRPIDYDLLSELLVHRFNRKDNRTVCAGIDLAVDVVDKVSDEALLGLTVAHAITSLSPLSGGVNSGLDVLNDLFGKIIYGQLPSGDQWLDHLDLLNAVRLNSFGGLKKIQQWYSEKLPGYVDAGIQKNSEAFIKAASILDGAGLPKTLLVEHELNPGFCRIPVVNLAQIKSLSLQLSGVRHGSPFTVTSTLSDEQVASLNSIYALYSQDGNAKQASLTKFMEEWNKRSNLKTLREWWDSIPVAFTITSAGKVLAHSNAQRCDGTLPPMD